MSLKFWALLQGLKALGGLFHLPVESLPYRGGQGPPGMFWRPPEHSRTRRAGLGKADYGRDRKVSDTEATRGADQTGLWGKQMKAVTDPEDKSPMPPVVPLS